MRELEDEVEHLCEVLHEAYEAAAATSKWETNVLSRKPWVEVPEANKVPMRAAVRAVLVDLSERNLLQARLLENQESTHDQGYIVLSSAEKELEAE